MRIPRSVARVLAGKRFAPVRRLVRESTQMFPTSEWYLVGGAVRDMLLRCPVGDIDIVVRGISLTQLQTFLRPRGATNIVGRHFGVIKFCCGGETYDIALPRTDHSFATGGYRDVKVVYDANLPLERDLERRDFTMNAIAVRLGRTVADTVLIDPFHGTADIKKHQLRTVGSASMRFREDYTRMLRAIRFSCQLGCTIVPETRRALRQYARMLVQRRKNTESGMQEYTVSRERIAKEFLHAFVLNPVYTLETYQKIGILDLLIPELSPLRTCVQPRRYHSEGSVWKHTMLALHLCHEDRFGLLRAFNTHERASAYLALLFHDAAKPHTASRVEKKGKITFYGHDEQGAKLWATVCSRLKLSSPEEYGVSCQNVAWVVRTHMLVHEATVAAMRNATIERYFFNPELPSHILLAVTFFDCLATVPAGRRIPRTKGELRTWPNLTGWQLLQKRIQALAPVQAGKQRGLPKPLLDGNHIMQLLHIPAGPQVGILKEQLREAQLAGKITNRAVARAFIVKAFQEM